MIHIRQGLGGSTVAICHIHVVSSPKFRINLIHLVKKIDVPPMVVLS
jgi:hypothetical protein